MKRVVLTLVTVLAVAAVFTGVGASSGDGGKVVASGFSCGIIDGNGNVFITNTSQLIEYATRAVLYCSGFGAPYTGPNPPFYWNTTNWPPPSGGGTCGMLQFGFTTDWVDKVGRAGHSQLTCQTNKSASASSAGAGVG